jgi:hypothetical protein
VINATQHMEEEIRKARASTSGSASSTSGSTRAPSTPHCRRWQLHRPWCEVSRSNVRGLQVRRHVLRGQQVRGQQVRHQQSRRPRSAGPTSEVRG